MFSMTDEKRLSLSEHLEELRWRLIYSLIFFGVALIICFIFQEEIMKIVCKPHFDAMRSLGHTVFPVEKLVALEYTEKFMAYFKVCLLASLILGAPFALYQLWKFISAGLYPQERKFVIFYAPLSLGLFVVGVLFGYFVLIPISLRFLALYGGTDIISLTPKLNSYLSLFITLTLILGLSFEIPLVMLFFSAIGLVSPAFYSKQRKLAIVAIFVLSAIITPTTDPWTMTILALPLVLLYEFGIIFSKLHRKPKL